MDGQTLVGRETHMRLEGEARPWFRESHIEDGHVPGLPLCVLAACACSKYRHHIDIIIAGKKT